MKKILLFLLMLLPLAVFGQKTTSGELIIFEKPSEALDIRSFKVSRAMDKGFALACGLSDDDYYGLTVLLYQDGKYFYDEEIVNCPTGKEPLQIGIYRYVNKTVPVIQFNTSSASVVNTIPNKADDNKVYDVVEQMPSFSGGPSALMQYLSSNIKYPVKAEEKKIQGRVVCTFVVERDGSITDVRVVNSVDPSLDKEAIRVVKSMPKWIPGRANGKPVRVKYTVPVTFRIQ